MAIGGNRASYQAIELYSSAIRLKSLNAIGRIPIGLCSVICADFLGGQFLIFRPPPRWQIKPETINNFSQDSENWFITSLMRCWSRGEQRWTARKTKWREWRREQVTRRRFSNTTSLAPPCPALLGSGLKRTIFGQSQVDAASMACGT